ncbi:hypothetical protein PHMEG_0008336 [Phytophthora megakarya]|uniref:Uncharacterized protein n=1 Tax=Phytophthora megakarya TaxID=4795 RepID=A0A225WIY7_9STRA|nr:hypothetical protein PHMEG_0008336 [Phytophthora megakarya]
MDEPDDHLNTDGHPTAIKRLTNLVGVPLVGRLSHRPNLTVREYLGYHDSIIKDVQHIMRRLRTLKQAAMLRFHENSSKTLLAAVVRQDTRWSSTFSMVKRYYRLRELILVDEDDLEGFLPTQTAHRHSSQKNFL